MTKTAKPDNGRINGGFDEQEGSTNLKGYIVLDKTRFEVETTTGEFTDKVSGEKKPYEKLTGQSENGTALRGAIWMATNYTAADEEARKPILTGRLNLGEEEIPLVGWRRYRHADKQPFIGLSEGRKKTA